MITLKFSSVDPSKDVTIGPVSAFRASGNFIRALPTHQIVAAYSNHYWEVEGEYFTEFSCAHPVEICFEDQEGGHSDCFGPFEQLDGADGALHADKQVLLALFRHESQLWHCFSNDTYWPALVIRPVEKCQPLEEPQREQDAIGPVAEPRRLAQTAAQQR